jgi:hypothetical protein
MDLDHAAAGGAFRCETVVERPAAPPALMTKRFARSKLP